MSLLQIVNGSYYYWPYLAMPGALFLGERSHLPPLVSSGRY